MDSRKSGREAKANMVLGAFAAPLPGKREDGNLTQERPPLAAVGGMRGGGEK
jgi:hypothetical protein